MSRRCLSYTDSVSWWDTRMLRILSEIRYAPCALSRHVSGHAGSVCQSHWDATAPTRLSGADPLLTSQLLSRRHGTKMPYSMSAESHPVTCSAIAWSMFYLFVSSQNGPQLVCSIKCCNLTQPIDTKRPHHSHQNDFGKVFLCSSNTQDGYRTYINSLQYREGAYCPIYLIFFPISRLI